MITHCPRCHGAVNTEIATEVKKPVESNLQDTFYVCDHCGYDIPAVNCQGGSANSLQEIANSIGCEMTHKRSFNEIGVHGEGIAMTDHPGLTSSCNTPVNPTPMKCHELPPQYDHLRDQTPAYSETPKERFWRVVRVSCPYGKYFSAHITSRGVDYNAEAELYEGEHMAKKRLFVKLEELGHFNQGTKDNSPIDHKPIPTDEYRANAGKIPAISVRNDHNA
jgi:hypothetical protein